MAGDLVGCVSRKRSSKSRPQPPTPLATSPDSSSCSNTDNNSVERRFTGSLRQGRENNGAVSPPLSADHRLLLQQQIQPQTTRGGLRVYKIVILGDGGVGKSGKQTIKRILVVYYLSQIFSNEFDLMCFSSLRTKLSNALQILFYTNLFV